APDPGPAVTPATPSLPQRPLPSTGDPTPAGGITMPQRPGMSIDPTPAGGVTVPPAARPSGSPAPGEQSKPPNVSTPSESDTEMWRPPTSPPTGPTATREPTIGPAPVRPPAAPPEPALPGMEADQKASAPDDKKAEEKDQKGDDAAGA
ncbi:MAG: hypothetical protein ACRD0O_22430, partial [Acidimicrobiia bacterium]